MISGLLFFVFAGPFSTADTGEVLTRVWGLGLRA